MLLDTLEQIENIVPLPGRAILENLPTYDLTTKKGLHLPANAFHMPPLGKAKVVKINYRKKTHEEDIAVKEGSIVYYHTTEASLSSKYTIMGYGVIALVMDEGD